jgi:hypothetical protein
MFNALNPDHDSHVVAHYFVQRRREIEASSAKAREALIKAGKLKG